MDPVIVPPIPELSDYEKINYATEVAFGALLEQARSLGYPLSAMGLMYLPDQAITRQFQEACRAVIHCVLPQSHDQP
jgi:hypothetical protein